MAVKFTNNAATTLAAGINSSVTSIAVTDGSVFPTITGSDHFYVTFDDTTNKEIVKVTARSGNTLTVVRGHDNTTARAFSSGDKAELRIVAALLDDVKTDVSSTLTVDTFTGDGSTTAFTLSAAPASEDNLIVFIEGVYQNPGDFTLSGTTLTLDVAPANSRKIIVYHVSHLVSGNNLTHNQFTCNGSTTAFTLSLSPIHENNTQVFLDGVYQQKTDYAVSGTTLTMDTAPANGAILEVMTFTQTEVNTLPASFVSGLTEVTAVGADHFMIFDATDSALKKSLVSDVLESATSISTSADATAITIDSNEKVTFTSDVTTGGHLSVGGSNNELRFYEGSNYVGFEAPALSADKIWVLPAADGSNGQVISTDGSGNLSFATISGTTINNNADNRIITGSGTANTLEGEANFVFDGQNAGIGVSTVDNTSSASHTLQLASVTDNNWSGSLLLTSADASSVYSRIVASTDGLDLVNTKNTNMRFFTNNTERVRINNNGTVGIGSGSRTDQMLMIQGAAPQIEVINTSNSYSPLSFVNNTNTNSYNDIASIGAEIDSGSAKGRIVFKTRNTDGSGSQTERMRIDSSGRVGIGTNNPGVGYGGAITAAKVAILSGAAGSNGGSSTLLIGGDDKHYAYMQGTHTSSGNTQLDFGTANGANNPTQRATLNEWGAWKVKSTSGAYFSITSKYHEINSNDGALTTVLIRNGSTYYASCVNFWLYGGAPNNTQSNFWTCNDTVGQKASLQSNGGFYNYQSNNSNLCDEREKKNIEVLGSTWNSVKSWDLKKFHYNEDADSDDKRLGVIAQEIETTNPELITAHTRVQAKDAVLWTEEDDLPEGVSIGDIKTAAQDAVVRKGVKEQQMYIMAIKALQEAMTEIESLKARIETLEG